MTRARNSESGGCGFAGMAAAGIGLALVGLGVFMLLSFATADVTLSAETAAKTCWTGTIGIWVAYGGQFSLGVIPSILLAMLVTFWGLHVVASMRFLTTWPQVAGGMLLVAAAALGLCAFSDTFAMSTGGLLAVYASPPAILYFGRWGLGLAAIAAGIFGILLAFGETAVYGTHWLLFSARDFSLGTIGIVSRLAALCKLLVTPRLAVASGPAAGETLRSARLRPRSAEPTSARFQRRPDAEAAPAGGDTEDRSADPAPEEADDEWPGAGSGGTEPVRRAWAPREGFTSKYLKLDLRGNPPAAAAIPARDKTEPESIRVAIAPQAEETAAGNAKASADVILDVDVDADAEEPSGGDADARSPVTAAGAGRETPPVVDPLAGAAPAAPRPSPFAASPKPAAKPEPAARSAAGAVDGREKPETAPAADLSGYRLPPLELLDPPNPPVIEDPAVVEARIRILEQTLAEFKIEGRVVHVERGPRVTLYEISLAPGIRLNKVTSLADNIAMQLQAESIRIIAPIPGKNTIGIEIPNSAKELVSLREIVGAVNREKRRQALPVCLGKDISGQALVADLSRMPHLLIAGATGSGKSVCINSIILSVMMCCRPDEAQLIMVDPKVVELSRFKDIPHLMSPVITDMKRAVSVLEWICQKMDERYEQMSLVSVNNIAKFNALGEEGVRGRLDAFASLEEIEAFPKKMPYMVVIIDELADLMMVAGKEVEHHITRLAAKSRAVGIHLILATQRPSVDVITGLIKANMPCRIAFQVASRVDSRTILDQNGADSLLGQGDMLFLPPGVGKLTRAQGVFVSDEELFRVVDFTKAEAEPQYHSDLLGPVIGGGSGAVDISEFDELFIRSGEAIIENQRGSVSLLQRKFGIGYSRASRIIDQLASVGLLGPFRDGKAREILLDIGEFTARFGGGDSGGTAWDDGSDAAGVAGLRDDERERPDLPWDDGEDKGER